MEATYTKQIDDTYLITCKEFPLGFGFEYIEDANNFEISNIKSKCKFKEQIHIGDILIKINNIDITEYDKYKIYDIIKDQVQLCKNTQNTLYLRFKKGTEHLLRNLYLQQQTQINTHNNNYNQLLQIENVANKYEHLKNNPDTTLNTYTSGYKTGIINPLKKDVLKSILNIDTLFAKERKLPTFKTNDFVYDAPETLQNVVSLKLSSIEIPNIWYNISEEAHNNKFKIEIKNYSDGEGNYLDSSHIIVLPDGNYTATNMVNYINNYFFNIKEGLDFIFFTIDRLTGQTIFRAFDKNDSVSLIRPKPYDTANAYYSPNLVIKLNFNYVNGEFLEGEYDLFYYQQTLGWYLGFDRPNIRSTIEDTYEDKFTSNTGETKTYYNFMKSSRFFSNSIKRYLYLECIDYQNNFKDSVIANLGSYGGSLSRNVIARIPITAGSNTILLNNNSDMIFKQRDYFGPVTINKLRFRLLDNFGNLLPLNNNDYSMTIEITQIYS